MTTQTNMDTGAQEPAEAYPPYEGHPYQIDLVVQALRGQVAVNGLHWRQGREDPISGFTLARGIAGSWMAVYYILSDAENSMFDGPEARDTHRIPYLRQFGMALRHSGVTVKLGRVVENHLPTLWVSPESVYNKFYFGQPMLVEEDELGMPSGESKAVKAPATTAQAAPKQPSGEEDDVPTLREVVGGRLDTRLGDYARARSPFRVRRRSYRTPTGIGQRVTFGKSDLNTAENLNVLVDYLRMQGVQAESFPGQSWVYVSPERNPHLCK